MPQEPQEEQFKVGDVYYVELYKQKVTIEKVQDDTIFVFYEDGSTEQYTPQYCRLMVARKDWIKVVDEEMPQEPQEEQFKVGDKILIKELNQVAVITSLGELTFRYKIRGEDFEYSTTKRHANNLIKVKKWVKIKDEEIPQSKYKVGDKFKDTKVNDIVQIGDIRGGSIFLVDNEGLTISYSERELDMGIKSGLYKKVEEKKPRKPRTTKPQNPDKDKQIQHILDINLEDIDF
jgi:hypothetical protein